MQLQVHSKKWMFICLPTEVLQLHTPVIMIHGGSWSGGDKTDFNTDIPNLKTIAWQLCHF